MTGSNKFVKHFSRFVLEARGFSNTVGEYSTLTQDKIHESLDRYLSFNFKKGYTNYSDDVVISNALSQVSPEAARDFPINEILIHFRVAALRQSEFQGRSGWYLRNYDKYKIKKVGKGKVNLEIQCKITVPYSGLELDIFRAHTDINTVMNHELTHAYNDFKDPNFERGYRAAFMYGEVEKYDFLKKSEGLRNFLHLLYALTDDEIKAQLGEAEKYDSLEDLYNTEAYFNAVMGKVFNSEEYFNVISEELKDHRFFEYITNNFGEFFVDLYRAVSRKRSHALDPKVLALKKSAGLLEVLRFFEKYLNQQGEKLWRKLLKKVD